DSSFTVGDHQKRGRIHPHRTSESHRCLGSRPTINTRPRLVRGPMRPYTNTGLDLADTKVTHAERRSAERQAIAPCRPGMPSDRDNARAADVDLPGPAKWAVTMAQQV